MSDVITTRSVLADGHSLRVYESGAPGTTPVLWLHGSGPGVNALANWRGMLTDLASEYHNLAPDLLGFGDSACPDPFPRGIMPSVDLRARNTLALLDELQVERTHVVGNSMGGMIAMRMAQLAPTRLGKIVLMGSAGRGGLEPAAAAMSMTFATAPTPQNMKSLLQMFVYDEATFGIDLDELAAQRLALAMRPDIVRVNAATFDPVSLQPDFPPAALAELSQETLVVHGREDRVLSVERAYYLAEHIPNAQLHVFPHSGHWAHLEQHDRFKALLIAFLNGSL
jgi:2-hydroxymuconate-semialdehyde hydrolase